MDMIKLSDALGQDREARDERTPHLRQYVECETYARHNRSSASAAGRSRARQGVDSRSRPAEHDHYLQDKPQQGEASGYFGYPGQTTRPPAET
jgi:hypothetical protein